jgi:CheY-like chemotaxis protein
MPDNKRVLSIGSEPELLRLRHAVLRYAGFDVRTLENEQEAIETIRAGDCGVLLLCYSLPVNMREHLHDVFRSHCPDNKIVAIANQQLDTPYFGDVLVYGIDGPEALIQAIQGNS